MRNNNAIHDSDLAPSSLVYLNGPVVRLNDTPVHQNGGQVGLFTVSSNSIKQDIFKKYPLFT